MAHHNHFVLIVWVVALFVILPACAIEGIIPLSASSSLFIPSLPANIKVVTDNSLTSPSLHYSYAADVKEIVRITDGNQITFDAFSSTGPLDEDSSGTTARADKYFISSILGIAGGIVFSNSPVLSFAAISSLSLFALSSAASSPILEITLNVPTNYHFGSLEIKAPYTTLSSSSVIYIDSLVLGFCGEDQTAKSSISLNGIYVFTKLQACASDDVTLQNVRTASNSVVLNATSVLGNVQSTFLSAYYGSFKADAGNAVKVDGDCEISGQSTNSTTVGICGKKSSSSVYFKAGKNVQVDFGTGCKLNDWLGDPEPKDVISENTSILSFIPSFTVNASAEDASAAAAWSYYQSDGTTNAKSEAGTGDDAGATVIVQGPWTNKLASHTWYTINKRVLPKVYKGLTYNVQFEFRQEAANLIRTGSYEGYNISQLTIVYFENHESVWHATESKWSYPVEDDAYIGKYALGHCNLANPADLSRSTYARFGCSITASRNSDNAVIAFRAVNKDTNTNEFRYYFRNTLFTTPESTPVQVPTLLTRDSERITLRKVNLKLDANPRGDSVCPHLAIRKNGKYSENSKGSASEQKFAFFHELSLSPTTTITLPDYTDVLVSSCSVDDETIYNRIVIPATSSLVFDDAPIDFHVRDILVKGKLLIGSEKCRIFSNVSITFHGKATTENTISPNYGSKGVAVEPSGLIEMHGKQFHPTWSRIAASAAGGDDRVYLQDEVNWEVGQQIVVTATILNDLTHNQNEVVTITARKGKVVVFSPPLRYFHYGGQEYQAEVGLLDRRINIQGNFLDSQADNSSFGGHIQIMGQGKFSGVRFQRMGQLNRLARYPVHFHMIGQKGEGSFVRDCSFHQCFFRCISIHATHNTELTRNVAFDIKGHCYYLEDGTEENNTISYNLASYIKPVGRPAQGFAQGGERLEETADLTQPADSAAAGFYITNAYNRIVGNAATGGWAGFSFPNLYSPIHLSAHKAPFDPSSRPTLEFDSNTARGSGNIFANSGCIYVGGLLTHQQNDDHTGSTPLSYINGRYERATRWQRFVNGTERDSPDANFTMTNIKTSLCSMGVAHWSNAQLIGFESHDNFRSAMMFGKSWIGNALVVGRTANPLSGTPPLGSHQGFEFYDTYTHTILTNITFRNFRLIPGLQSEDPHQDNKVFVSMTHSDVFKPEAMSVVRNITFEDVDAAAILGVFKQNTGSSRMFNLYDTDGSVSSQIGFNSQGKPMLIGSYPNWWNFDSKCKFNADWNAWVCPRKWETQEIIYIGLYVDGFINYGISSMPYDQVGTMSLFGNGIPANDVRSVIVTRNAGITGLSHMGWLFELNNGSPTKITVNAIQIPRNSHFILAVPYPAGTTFAIETRQWNNIYLPFYYVFGRVNTFDELRNGNASVYFYDNSHLYVKIIDFAIDNIQDFERDKATVHTYNNGFMYTINAKCPEETTIDETTYCKNTPTVRPGYNW